MFQQDVTANFTDSVCTMNKMKKHKSITEICTEIDLIVENKDNKNDYKYLYSDFIYALQGKIEFSEIVVLCDTVFKIAKIKNRRLRYLEKDFWDFINKIPFQILLIQQINISEDEEIEPNIDYKNQGKKILSRLFGLSKEILGLPDDSSKGSELRRASALKLLIDLNDYYNILNIKNLFLNSIKSKNKSEQYNALEGLENYYEVTEEEIDNELIKVLNEIIRETNDRTVASTCLQIQINAGIIDELTAVCEIDDWKDEHYD